MVREAQELLRRDKVAEAIEAYKRILMQWPSLADCWFNLGYLLRRVRDHDGALLSYQKALELGVSEPESAHLNRAVIYADHLRQDEAAEDELKAALALNPDYVPALLNYANLHEDRGERADAAALYERVLVLDPTCFLALARHAGQRVAQERADRNGITATFGDATLATNVFKETDHEHFEIDNRVNARTASPVGRIGGGAKRTSLPLEIERVESFLEFGVKRRSGGPHQLGKSDEELRSGQ